MLARVLGVVCICAAAPVTGASAATGDLTQKAGQAGCVDSGSQATCVDATGLGAAKAVAVSPDGANVYVATNGAVVVLDRAADGTLTQRASDAGCIAQRANIGCRRGRGLYEAYAITVSPDGKSVYVSTKYSVVALDRAADGSLTQKPEGAGCVSPYRGDGCLRGAAFLVATSVAVSPDGTSVYVGTVAQGASGVYAFHRATDAKHALKPAGCFGYTGSACENARGMFTADAVTVSPDGKNVYVASSLGTGLSIFDRAADGGLTQKPATAGCVAHPEYDVDDCFDARRTLENPESLAVSPDGASVYVAYGRPSALGIFDRARNGVLKQKPGTAGCIADEPVAGCTPGRALGGASSVSVSGDGKSVYVASFGGVAVFDRSRDGTLKQRQGRAGCIEGDPIGDCAAGRALEHVRSAALSPDGKSVYVTSETRDLSFSGVLPGMPGYKPPPLATEGAVGVFDRQPPRVSGAISAPVALAAGAALLLGAAGALAWARRTRRRRRRA